MSKKRYQPEEIIGKLRHADVLLGQGKKIAEVIKALGVTDVTYYHLNTGRSIFRLLVLECASPHHVSSTAPLRTPSTP